MLALKGVPPARTLSFLLLAGLAFVFAGCGDRSGAPSGKKTSAPPPVTAWPMTRGGPALSGSVPARVPLAPKTAWTFTAPGAVNAEAAIAGGRVFVGSDKGRLHCLAADTGAEVWQFATDEKISSGAVVIKNPAGPEEWVLLNGYDGTTRVLHAADGKLVWSYPTNDYVNGAPAIVDGRWVVFGGCDAKLHVVNLADGKPVHSIPCEAYIPASIGTFGTMAFCGNYANQTVAFDVAAGKVAWTYEDRAMPFFSSPAVNDRLVLIGSRDKSLHAIHRTTGESAWKFKTGGRVEGSPIVFTDGVVFGSADGRLYAAHLDTGAELWRLELGEALVASPAFGENLIVIGGEKGTVFALRGAPGP